MQLGLNSKERILSVSIVEMFVFYLFLALVCLFNCKPPKLKDTSIICLHEHGLVG